MHTGIARSICAWLSVVIKSVHWHLIWIIVLFHRWEFDCGGKLLNVPAIAGDFGTSRTQKETPAVGTYPCQEGGGFIWLFWGDKHPSGRYLWICYKLCCCRHRALVPRQLWARYWFHRRFYHVTCQPLIHTADQWMKTCHAESVCAGESSYFAVSA